MKYEFILMLHNKIHHTKPKLKFTFFELKYLDPNKKVKFNGTI